MIKNFNLSWLLISVNFQLSLWYNFAVQPLLLRRTRAHASAWGLSGQRLFGFSLISTFAWNGCFSLVHLAYPISTLLISAYGFARDLSDQRLLFFSLIASYLLGFEFWSTLHQGSLLISKLEILCILHCNILLLGEACQVIVRFPNCHLSRLGNLTSQVTACLASRFCCFHILY